MFNSDKNKDGVSLDDVIKGLQKGIITPEYLPINYVLREGYMVIENNRAAVALMKAGIPEKEWDLRLVDEGAFIAISINNRLARSMENGVRSV